MEHPDHPDQDPTAIETRGTQRPDATDELAHRREVARLTASVVDHGAQVLRDLEELRKAGLSTEEAMREVWLTLPASFTARLPEDAFAQATGMLVNVATAFQRGTEEALDICRHLMAGATAGTGQDLMNTGIAIGRDYAMQQDVLRAESRNHNDQGRLRSFIKRVIKTSAVDCRVMLRSGGLFDGRLSETPDGLLALEQETPASLPRARGERAETYYLFFPYAELSSIGFLAETIPAETDK
jgi:hypothetical protein